MKASCKIIQDLLPLYCDEVCSEESKQTIEQHLQECEKCREELHFMQEEMKGDVFQAKEQNMTEAVAMVWKKGKKIAFIKGCLIALLGIVVVFGAYVAVHWLTTVDENNHNGLAQQAADYLGYDTLYVVEVEKRGNYLAALCKDEEENWCMCVYEKDGLFENRWYASGGKRSLKPGNIGSWNYGSPEREAVLIFCGGNISDEICWYQFQNSNITYTCPVDGSRVLDIFIIPDRNNINGYAIPLDSNQQKIQ